MNKKTLRIAAFALAITMLPGCGKSQEETNPTSVNQAMLIEKSAQEQKDYHLPEKFTGNWSGQEGRLTIHADAQVEAPQGTQLPIATVMPREFTQEDVDNLLAVCLKGQPLYDYALTKKQCQENIDRVNSPQWQPDPDAPEQTPEQVEQHRKDIIAYYTEQMKTAPEETPVVRSFGDCKDPNEVSGTATVDGVEYEVSIRNDVGNFWTMAQVIRHDFKYYSKSDWGGATKEDAIRQGNGLMQELGFDAYVLDDAQQQNTGEWQLCYVPTVNGIRLSSIREDRFTSDESGQSTGFQYYTYHWSEETDPDNVSWPMDVIFISVGGDGILSFAWHSPCTQPVIQESQAALMPFEEIASIAGTMLPVVVVGPKETPLVEVDKENGFETRMDVDITRVSLSLMRVRDKGSLQGTIVPVWYFWGTEDWYDAQPNQWGYREKGTSYTVRPVLTLNAIDGNVIDCQLGY